MTSRYGPYELVDNVDYGSHEQALTWLGEQYAGPLNVATGYVGLEGLDTLARIAGERGGVRGSSSEPRHRPNPFWVHLSGREPTHLL